MNFEQLLQFYEFVEFCYLRGVAFIAEAMEQPNIFEALIQVFAADRWRQFIEIICSSFCSIFEEFQLFLKFQYASIIYPTISDYLDNSNNILSAKSNASASSFVGGNLIQEHLRAIIFSFIRFLELKERDQEYIPDAELSENVFCRLDYMFWGNSGFDVGQDQQDEIRDEIDGFDFE